MQPVALGGHSVPQFTVCVSTGDVLVLKFVSPLYTAVIEWLPRASDDVVKLAFPLLSVPDPITVVPSLKVTVPVGVPVVEDETIAVNVTGWPKVDGFCDDVTVVVVLALFTVCFRIADVFGL